MKINLGNGSVKLNTKTLPINWTGQYAQHVTDNYINKKPCHSILHIEIQQALSKSRNIEKDGTNTYVSKTETPNGIIHVSFIKSTNFVTITTGYIMQTTMEKATKNKKKSVGNIKRVLPIQKEHIEARLSDGFWGNDEEEIKRGLISLFTRYYKKEGYKNFELEFV